MKKKSLWLGALLLLLLGGATVYVIYKELNGQDILGILKSANIGWILLACLTCGIGFLFLTPYMQTARVAFYHDIANREAASDVEFPSLDPDDYSTEV